jgi:hypothetical protein
MVVSEHISVTHLNSRRVTVDLPLPVAPTNATVLPPGTLNEICTAQRSTQHCTRVQALLMQ